MLVEDPHITSRAAYLKIMLKLWEESDHPWYKWLSWKQKYLKKLLRRFKGQTIYCCICGKPIPLDVKNPSGKSRLTIEHIHSLGTGGARYDESNLGLAHRSCNNGKDA